MLHWHFLSWDSLIMLSYWYTYYTYYIASLTLFVLRFTYHVIMLVHLLHLLHCFIDTFCPEIHLSCYHAGTLITLITLLHWHFLSWDSLMLSCWYTYYTYHARTLIYTHHVLSLTLFVLRLTFHAGTPTLHCWDQTYFSCWYTNTSLLRSDLLFMLVHEHFTVEIRLTFHAGTPTLHCWDPTALLSVAGCWS